MADSLIVLNADGAVLAVDATGSPEWIGARIEELADVPADVRRASAETRRRLNQSVTGASVASTTANVASQSVRVVALHAVAVRRVATDLRALLEGSVEVMADQARAIEAALTVDVSPDVPRTLYLDPEKIAWAVTALVGNALRFVRRGTRLMPGGAITVRAQYVPAASEVALEVQDDGSGIAPERLARMLVRSPERPQTSALALTLVRDVAAAHGGSLNVESSTDAGQSGTRVRLTLPCP